MVRVAPIISAAGPVVLVGGGPIPPGALDREIARGGPVVAADGGAGAVLEAGHLPDAVIGDMDSIAPSVRQQLSPETLHAVTEQESTDFEKCLRRIEAPLVLGLGFLGGRTDHTLAALSCLVRAPRPVLLLGSDALAFAAPRDLRLSLRPGTWVSLFPLAPVRGRSTGLRWAIDGIDFRPAGPVGTSNEATGPVRISMEGPGMVVLLPPEAREAAMEALAAARPERFATGARFA